MRRLVLANVDYEQHMTDEGEQFQRGLEHAGWTLAGVGYGDGCADVGALLNRHGPEVVVVHDKRDWDPASRISFRKDVGFMNMQALVESDVPRGTVIKDAATFSEYQAKWIGELRPNFVVVYYLPRIVVQVAPYLAGLPIVRTWHTVDAKLLSKIPLDGPRERGVVSGAIDRRTYPTRWTAARFADLLGISILPHAGYGNRGSDTPNYLRRLSGFRVHVATASRFGFALRKIIESVACGCTPVTDLPDDDVLPEIDGALLRIPHGASRITLRDAVARADDEWNLEERAEWARKAREFYDWRAMGTLLDSGVRSLNLVGASS